MKREIKFRAWMDDGNNQMRYTGDYSAKRIGSGTDLSNLIFMAEKHDWPLMQFTGLCDKNGKEIYEGDILAYKTFYYGNEKDRRQVVKWDKWTSDDFGQPECVGYFNLDGTEEVIGNIYENPELLEVN